MARVVRHDQGQLGKPIKTAQGLRIEGYASRPGVYEYTNTREDEKDGLGRAGTTRRELRPDDEQFSPEVLAGYAGASLTDGHPGKLIASNPALRARYAKGVVLSARRDGDRIAITAMVTDPALVKTIEDGKRELSPGYSLELDRTAGVDPKYGRYDAIQRKLGIDHNAVVDGARGGHDMAFRLDGDGETIHSDEDMGGDPGAKKCDYDLDGCDGSCMDWMPEGSEDGEARADDLSSEARNNLADSKFALADKRKLPIHDAGHVRAAMGGHGLSAVEGVSDEDKAKAAKKIVAAAKKHGIDASGFAEKHGLPFEKPEEKRTDMADPIEPTTIDELRKQRDDAKSEASRLGATIVALQGDVEDLKKKVDTDVDKKLKEANTRADAAVEAFAKLKDGYESRVIASADLRAKSVMLLGERIRLDGKSDDEVCTEVLRQLTPSEGYATKDATWRRVRVDELAQRRGKSVEERAAISRMVRGDASDDIGTVDRNDNRHAPKVKHTDLWSAGPPHSKKKEI